MKLIHTADWHLGKNIEGHSRLEEQRLFLKDFINICEEEQADIIIIAGDIYDNYNPSAMAEQLFYDTLKQLSRNGDCMTVVIAGNHDNPERLVASGPLARDHGIVMAGTPNSVITPGMYGKNEITESDVGYIHAIIHGEEADILLVPFPSEKRLNEVYLDETEEETKKLLNLETNLHKRIIGQEDAVNSVSRAIRRNRAGLKSTKRPPSFIFVGPTGVGKTELAKSLAYEMFGSEDSIIRIDMSEYMESHSTSKLIGAPPGYVGYDDAGQLTDKVKRKPYSIILLDEIEKAHPDVFNILLQVLDDGKLTDSQGNTVSFSNTIIIMTSNAGSNLNTNSIGFGNKTVDKDKIIDNLKEVFRPEFLNRIDEIISFDPLTKDQLLQIVDLMLKDTIKALNEKDIKTDISKKAKNFILEKGTDVKFGARPLRRAIQRYIEDELSEMILKGELLDGQTVKIDSVNNELKFEVK